MQCNNNNSMKEMLYEVRCFEMKIWSSHLLDNLSNCLMNLKNSGDSTGFEPMTSAMPVQCSNQLSYKVTQLRAGQLVGFMFSRERNVIWKKCYMKSGVIIVLMIINNVLIKRRRNNGGRTGSENNNCSSDRCCPWACQEGNRRLNKQDPRHFRGQLFKARLS